jgi:hypothetical protein
MREQMRRAGVTIAVILVGSASLAAVSAASSGGWGAPYSCHVRGSGLYVLPDPQCTPGAINPAVTQANIDSTICMAGWSTGERPPEAVTEPQKWLSLAAYGFYDGRSLGNYEFDHLISLELGGAADSPENLWPERNYPGVPPISYYLNPKDHVENDLNHAVCDGKMSLASAQHIIASNWVGWYRAHIGPTSTVKPTPAPVPTKATCTVSGSWSDDYHDFDVYVHSDQPDDRVTVTDSDGTSATYYTDSSGYAVVYLYAPESASGEGVTATAGAARCSGTL